MTTQMLTAEEFSRQRFDLPEGGRWSELIAGEITRFDPPDDVHGTIVLNLSKAVAATLQKTAGQAGYACFDQPVLVRRKPDTVLSPPMSVYAEGPWFAELDEDLSTTTPQLVCEIASTNDRRRSLGQRVKWYREAGVAMVWVVDPHQQHLHVYPADEVSYRLSREEFIEGTPELPLNEITVADLLREPEWWSQA